MLRRLGVTKILGYAALAMVAVAVWQGFHGDLGAMIDWIWNFIQGGADLVTRLWNSANSHSGK